MMRFLVLIALLVIVGGSVPFPKSQRFMLEAGYKRWQHYQHKHEWRPRQEFIGL